MAVNTRVVAGTPALPRLPLYPTPGSGRARRSATPRRPRCSREHSRGGEARSGERGFAPRLCGLVVSGYPPPPRPWPPLTPALGGAFPLVVSLPSGGRPGQKPKMPSYQSLHAPLFLLPSLGASSRARLASVESRTVPLRSLRHCSRCTLWWGPGWGPHTRA